MNIPTWSLTPFCSYFWAVHLGILWSFGNQGHSPWYLWCFDGSPMYVQPDCPWLLFSKPVNLPIFQVPNGTQPIPKDSLLDLGALMMSLSYHVSHLLRSLEGANMCHTHILAIAAPLVGSWASTRSIFAADHFWSSLFCLINACFLEPFFCSQ